MNKSSKIYCNWQSRKVIGFCVHFKNARFTFAAFEIIWSLVFYFETNYVIIVLIFPFDLVISTRIIKITVTNRNMIAINKIIFLSDLVFSTIDKVESIIRWTNEYWKWWFVKFIFRFNGSWDWKTLEQLIRNISFIYWF